jgi:predicted metal-dependent HD superfamily phosphohydrolase
MKERWLELAPPGDDADRIGDQLITRWSEPHRRYHTLDHLRRMLDVVDEHHEQADDPRAVRLASWFHDAIYDATRNDNEARSAELARSALTDLGVPSDEVVRLVELTATHDVRPGDRNGALLVDADLAILAASPQEYATYTQQVRAEYAFVPDRGFALGRAEILRRFLDRPAIYHITELRQAWEAQARANIMTEIDALDAAARHT